MAAELLKHNFRTRTNAAASKNIKEASEVQLQTILRILHGFFSPDERRKAINMIYILHHIAQKYHDLKMDPCINSTSSPDNCVDIPCEDHPRAAYITPSMKMFRKMAADKSGATGDEDIHHLIAYVSLD